MTEGRPWHERYQTISYKLTTRSGDEIEFADMVRRCNAVGVRIYPDLIINHMTGARPAGSAEIGTGGSTANYSQRSYPDVPFYDEHFNTPICAIENYDDVVAVRNCELVGLRDLNQTIPYVREKIIELMNKLTDIGVAGFRVDAAKHIWPSNLKIIYDSLKSLNPEHGFKRGAKPFIFQEVSDFGNAPIKGTEYTWLGAITEFRFSLEIGKVFRGQFDLRRLKNWGRSFFPSKDVVTFIDNHDNQRDGNPIVLSYKYGQKYRMATAFALAHPYGTFRVMSSYYFPEGAKDQGPPHDEEENILSPTINADGLCGNGWVCEHRWPTTAKMVSFRNVAGDAPISMWFDNGRDQVAFSRGYSAFIAFNREENDFNRELNTKLPAGTYCDIISGQNVNNSCTGLRAVVNGKGIAHIVLPANSTEGVFAIHVGPMSKLS